jgi:AraC-like DNA-binding protein
MDVRNAIVVPVRQPRPSVLIRASTADVDAKRRLDYWTETFGAIWGDIELAPTGASPIRGALQSVQLGSLRINRLEFEGMAFRRLQKQRREPFFSLAFPHDGRSVVELGHDHFELRPGEVYLLDNSLQKTELRAAGRYETRNIQIPIHQLRERLGRTWSLGSPQMESSSVVLELLKTLVRQLLNERHAIDDRSAEFLERKIYDLVAFCLADPAGASSEEGAILTAHRERADRCIRRLFRQPNLDPGQIATACGISESYIHKIYQSSGRTVMERVREARLDAAQEALQMRSARTTVSEIAYDVGFKSLAEFSRAFKRRFGHSPTSARPGRL